METVASVCKQNYPDIQYIIVDDGPNCVDDEITQYIEGFDSITDFILLRNPGNMGISYSLNRAIDVASGEIIFNIADDDCFYDNNVIKDWVSEFIKTGAMAMTAFRAVYDNAMSKQLRIEPTDKIVEKIRALSNEELFEEMTGYNYIFGCVTAKRRQLFDEDYGKYNPDYRTIEDYSSNMILLRNGVRFVFFDRIVLKYREGGNSSVTSINKAYLKESDMLFRREILPFTKSKIKAIAKYWNWKHGLKKDQRRKASLNKKGKS